SGASGRARATATLRHQVESASDGNVVMRYDCGPGNLRPGGFISGPTQMALADSAAYAVVFTRAGITPMALTSNLNINFLRPCQGDTLKAHATLLKYGKSGVVVEVELRGSSSEKVSSHATVTYVVPPEE
ncbi:MAG: PaaI family thioesterase, partial [Pseudomonadota bacterium]